MFALLLLLATVWPSIEITDSVERLELNHFYDTKGQHMFSQVIAWEWDRQLSRYVVRDFVAVTMRDATPPVRGKQALPDGKIKVFVADRQRHHVRQIVADTFAETWTQFDPELENRVVRGKESRSLLSRPLRRPEVTP